MKPTSTLLPAAAIALSCTLPATEAQQIAMQPPSAAPSGGIVRFSTAVDGVPEPGMRSYALRVRFLGAAVNLVAGELDTSALPADRLSCSAQPSTQGPLDEAGGGGGRRLQSGQGGYTLDSAGGNPVLAADNRVEGSAVVVNFGANPDAPRAGGGALVDWRCFAGSRLADGTVVYVLPEPWRHPRGGEALPGAILLDQADPTPVGDDFAYGVIRIGDPSARLDVDADGRVNALTDGLLALRYQFGVRGPQLIAGALGNACRRCDPDAIEDYLQASTDLGILDADDDTQVTARGDGQLLVRYELGLRGAALVAGAVVSPTCDRCDATEIQAHLDPLTR